MLRKVHYQRQLSKHYRTGSFYVVNHAIPQSGLKTKEQLLEA